jgi:hypothetical protein
MAQVTLNNSTVAPDRARRRFLAVAAAASAVSAGSLAIAAAPVADSAIAKTSQPNDAELLRVEDEILQQYDGEIARLGKICKTRLDKLRDDLGVAGLTNAQVLECLNGMPESSERDRLIGLRDAHFERMNGPDRENVDYPGSDAGRPPRKVPLTYIGLIGDAEIALCWLRTMKGQHAFETFCITLAGHPLTERRPCPPTVWRTCNIRSKRHKEKPAGIRARRALVPG